MPLEFVLTTFAVARHGRLCGDTHFKRPSELDANDARKRHVVQALNNPINIFKNKSKLYFISCFLNKYL